MPAKRKRSEGQPAKTPAKKRERSADRPAVREAARIAESLITAYYTIHEKSRASHGDLSFRFHPSREFSLLRYVFDGKDWQYSPKDYSGDSTKKNNFVAHAPMALPTGQKFSERLNDFAHKHSAPVVPVAYTETDKPEQALLMMMVNGSKSGYQNGDEAVAFYGEKGKYCTFDAKPRAPRLKPGSPKCVLSTPISKMQQSCLPRNRTRMPANCRADDAAKLLASSSLSNSDTPVLGNYAGRKHERSHTAAPASLGGKHWKIAGSASNTARMVPEAVLKNMLQCSDTQLKVSSLYPDYQEDITGMGRDQRLKVQHKFPFHGVSCEYGEQSTNCFVVDFPKASANTGMRDFGRGPLKALMMNGVVTDELHYTSSESSCKPPEAAASTPVASTPVASTPVASTPVASASVASTPARVGSGGKENTPMQLESLAKRLFHHAMPAPSRLTEQPATGLSV